MHELEFNDGGRRWRADLAAPVDLAIRLGFDGAQPLFFTAEPARAEPLRSGGFVGDVESGASCNCSVLTLAPHCHGTHTETVGHVTVGGPDLARLTPAPPALALLLSVEPVSPGSEATARSPALADDRVVTREVLVAAADRWLQDPWSALVVRTLPNEPSKRERAYAGPSAAPYFSSDAMRWIVERGVTSLVVDLPSLDRADDGGALAAHRIFWGLPPGESDACLAVRGHALVTELAYVPDSAADDLYLLMLHAPAFGTDAAPSRPVLYPVTERRR